MVDLKISIFRMMAFLKPVLATGTFQVGWAEVHNFKLNGILAPAASEGFPLIPIEPYASADIALVYFYAELKKDIHLQFALGTLELLQFFYPLRTSLI
jgi:hypothetical protein